MKYNFDQDLITQFQTHLIAQKRVSQNTVEAYKRDVTQLILFLHKNEITIRNCQVNNLKAFLAHIKEKGISSKSMARKISSIKMFFDFIHRNYGIENRAEHLIFPKISKHLPVYLTNEEVNKLLEVSSQDESMRGLRNKVIVYLLYATGIRVSELINLKTSDIRFDEGFIFLIGKGEKERSIPLVDSIKKFLHEYVEKIRPHFLLSQPNSKAFFLFPSFSKGKERPLSRQLIWIIIKGLIKKAGIIKNVSPHSLRHSLATHLLQNGADLRSLQMWLGHETISTVELYTHLDSTELRKIYDKAHPRAF